MSAGRCYLVMQRGHHDQPFCLDSEDRDHYLASVMAAALGQGLWVHAWAVLDRVAYLLVTPQRASSLSAVMQQLGRRYARHFNSRWGRRGSPWDGRYRSCWVNAETLGLVVSVWMDHQICAMGLAADPSDWRWGSACILAGAGRAPATWPFQPLPAYWSCGNTPFEREAAYRGLLCEGVRQEDSAMVASALSRGSPILTPADWLGLGDDEKAFWETRPRGRPRRSSQA